MDPEGSSLTSYLLNGRKNVSHTKNFLQVIISLFSLKQMKNGTNMNIQVLSTLPPEELKK
jgi:hypothetical protein